MKLYCTIHRKDFMKDYEVAECSKLLDDSAIKYVVEIEETRSLIENVTLNKKVQL